MEKTYRLVINEQEVSISLNKQDNAADVIRLPITYFQNGKYVSQNAFFHEIREKIRHKFGTKPSNVKLDFDIQDYEKLEKMIKENQRSKD